MISPPSTIHVGGIEPRPRGRRDAVFGLPHGVSRRRVRPGSRGPRSGTRTMSGRCRGRPSTVRPDAAESAPRTTCAAPRGRAPRPKPPPRNRFRPDPRAPRLWSNRLRSRPRLRPRPRSFRSRSRTAAGREQTAELRSNAFAKGRRKRLPAAQHKLDTRHRIRTGRPLEPFHPARSRRHRAHRDRAEVDSSPSRRHDTSRPKETQIAP